MKAIAKDGSFVEILDMDRGAVKELALNPHDCAIIFRHNDDDEVRLTIETTLTKPSEQGLDTTPSFAATMATVTTDFLRGAEHAALRRIAIGITSDSIGETKVTDEERQMIDAGMERDRVRANNVH